jgi:aspartate/methionine/tyrosine aminotransferase
MKQSTYMHWAKTRPAVPYDLALSGVIPYPLESIPVHKEQLVVTAQSMYGYEPLQQAIATRYGVNVDHVVAANGCSGANHLAMAALLEPGDHVLMEHPVYDPILSVAQFLRAEVVPFHRRPENHFRIDPDELARLVTPLTRLIVLTNLHNPSGVVTTQAELEAVGQVARKVGAHVLVDEVYLGVLFDQEPSSSILLGREFLITNSLTKAYGLGSLRCGWILAEPVLARTLWRMNDLFGVSQPHIAERLAVVAFENLATIADRARALLERNRTLLLDFLATRNELDVLIPEFGTTVFPRLRKGKVEQLTALLLEKYQTAIVPGRFFSMPEHFRLGICGEIAAVAGGLERLGSALDEL